MKSEKKNEKVNLDEVAITLGVDDEVIEKVRTASMTPCSHGRIMNKRLLK